MGQKKSKIYVAMSGGVDSSVAAALLNKRGFDVVGVFFKPWSPPNATSNFCGWEQDRLDAMRVCAKIDIPFKTWDFSKEYGKHVAQYMIDGYRAGVTPNPDVMCNKEIKFGLFLKRALKDGADYIATGHYVRLAHNLKSPVLLKIKDKKTETLRLLRGRDANKDQSYFLWTLTQKQLKHCLFPIGDYIKPEVRKLAKKFGLHSYNKKDSQGVCFIGQLNMKEFLTSYIKPKRGEIKFVNTNMTIGQHDGAYYYTIGQRHGLDIKDGHGPYFVVSKNTKSNTLYVTSARQISNLKSKTSKAEKVSWVGEMPKLPLDCQVKIRYRSKSVSANVSRLNLKMGRVWVKFKKPVRALTPGQSAVFYRGQEVLGGGIIS